MLYSIVLCCIELYCIVLYCIVLYSIVFYRIILYYIVLYYIALCCIVLYCIASFNSMFHNISNCVAIFAGKFCGSIWVLAETNAPQRALRHPPSFDTCEWIVGRWRSRYMMYKYGVRKRYGDAGWDGESNRGREKHNEMRLE